MPRTKQNANLKRGNPPTQFTSGQRAVECGRKGGIKTGKQKRLKKNLKQMAQIFAALPVPDDVKEHLKEYGVSAEDMVHQMALVAAMFEAGEKGSVRAAALLSDWLSEDGDETGRGVLEDILSAVKDLNDD